MTDWRAENITGCFRLGWAEIRKRMIADCGEEPISMDEAMKMFSGAGST